MNLLLGLGIPPDVADADGLTALAHAVSRNDEPMARALLEAGATPQVGPAGPDRSLLEQAIRDGGRDMVELLLAHGADATVLSREGQPLLPLAVALGRTEITAALLDAGVAVDTELAPAPSEEFLALVPGKYARYYLTRDEGVRPLMVAVLRGDLEMTRLLLERGASTGPTRGLFKYPLGLAADRRDITMMQVLLGRDPEEAARHATNRRLALGAAGDAATNDGKATLQTRHLDREEGLSNAPWRVRDHQQAPPLAIHDLPGGHAVLHAPLRFGHGPARGRRASPAGLPRLHPRSPARPRRPCSSACASAIRSRSCPE